MESQKPEKEKSEKQERLYGVFINKISMTGEVKNERVDFSSEAHLKTGRDREK